MKPALGRKDAAHLLLWLRSNVEDKARELRAAGWKEEDGHGLWSMGRYRNLHLLDAHLLLGRGHD